LEAFGGVMKKLLLILIIISLTVPLIGGANTKLVRFTVINASGDVVNIKLEGLSAGSFYYLTIPDGETKVFTIQKDVYKRTTWACSGVKSTGRLILTSQVRLKFITCNTLPLAAAP